MTALMRERKAVIAAAKPKAPRAAKPAQVAKEQAQIKMSGQNLPPKKPALKIRPPATPAAKQRPAKRVRLEEQPQSRPSSPVIFHDDDQDGETTPASSKGPSSHTHRVELTDIDGNLYDAEVTESEDEDDDEWEDADDFWDEGEKRSLGMEASDSRTPIQPL